MWGTSASAQDGPTPCTTPAGAGTLAVVGRNAPTPSPSTTVSCPTQAPQLGAGTRVPLVKPTNSPSAPISNAALDAETPTATPCYDQYGNQINPNCYAPTFIPPTPGPMGDPNQQACNDLLIELSTKTQPFGIQSPSATPPYTQPDLPAGAHLIYYPAYHQRNPAYDGDVLTYADRPNEKAIPCALTDSTGNLIGDGRNNIIMRFAGPQDLRLLNYGSYFAHLSYDWCSPAQTPIPPGTPTTPNDPGDNVFDQPAQAGSNGGLHSVYGNRVIAQAYRAGYNMPPEIVNCRLAVPPDIIPPATPPPAATQNTPKQIFTGAVGPCVTFLSSLFRAMHLYNPTAYSDVTVPYQLDFNQTVSQAKGPYAKGLSTIYYGVGFAGRQNVYALRFDKDGEIGSNQPVFLHRYTPLTIYFLKTDDANSTPHKFYGITGKNHFVSQNPTPAPSQTPPPARR